MPIFFRFSFLFAAIGLLLGCAGESRVFQESMSAIWQSNKFKDPTLGATLNPIYRYLRGHNSHGVILMVWGYVDVDSKSNVLIEVWYSGSKEAIKLQDGRVVATTGLNADWLAVRYQGTPSWTQLLANPEQIPVPYSRSVDLKLNYQFGKTQAMTLTRIPAPEAHKLPGVSAVGAQWFEERAESSQLPPTIYAVVPNWMKSGQAKVVYTWHCFKQDECFGFQEWTVQDQAAVKP
jgi:Group 4 capsule polysaccharide lipoprotein gfcB, YjbF